MNTLELIISPFIFIIKQIFLFSYDLTSNYGLSIILLSFVISLMLLPIFILIEKAKKRDDKVKLKMKPLVDEIKRCYKGQERYYYLKTLNRQHNYSPLRALIPILSLLLQIPFFIAAYQFLEHFEPLTGVSFIFIKDLAEPDALFGAINILPIAMTLVNLLTAYFYTRNGDSSERKQMLIVAGVFLVLLFNLPSGLVLYWTMNNVFSFFRLFITNKEVFEKNTKKESVRVFTVKTLKSRFIPLIPKLKSTFIILTIVSILSQFNWAFQHNFDDLVIRIGLAIVVSLSITIILSFLIVFHKIELSSNKKSLKEYFYILWPIFKPIFLILSTLIIISQINWALKFSFDDIILRLILSVFAGVVITLFIILIVLFYQGFISLNQQPRGKSTRYDMTKTFSNRSKHRGIIPTGGNKKNQYLNITYFGRPFLFLFLVLFTLAVYSQINWALKFSFDDIVVRLAIALIGSWATTILIANLIQLVKRDPELTTHKIKIQVKFLYPKLKLSFLIITLVLIVTQLNWAIQHNFSGFVLRVILAIISGIIIIVLVAVVIIIKKRFDNFIDRIKVKPWIFFSLLFLATYFYYASKFYYSGINIDLSIFSIIVLIPAQLIGLLYFTRLKSTLNNFLFNGVAFVLTMVLSFQVLNLYVLLSGVDFNFTLFNIEILIGKSILNDIISSGIIFTLITLPYFYTESEIKLPKVSNAKWLVYTLSILLVTGFIFLWNPLLIYSSYPANFEFPAIDILKNNFKLFSIISISLIIIYLILPKKIKYLWLVFVLGITILSFLHNTIMPINVGTLQGTKFVNQSNISQPLLHYVFEGIVILLILFGVRWIINNDKTKYAVVTLIVLNIILISQSLIEISKTGVFLKKKEVSADISNSISFSKDKENIVFVIFDMFHGWYVKQIIEENPKLRADLDGFTWYPNTLSVSSITSSSIGPILGGFDYTIDKLNKDNRTLQDKITDITNKFYNKVKFKGYDFTANKLIYSKIDKNSFDTFLPKWHKNWDQWNSKLSIGLSKEIGYTLLWENAFFYSSPIFLKPKIYNNGKWLHGDVSTNENTSSTKPYNFLRLLPYISNSDNDQPNFIYIHSMASHHPWDIINNEGKIVEDVTPYENNKWTLKTFANWLDWMKENNVYDNTKIILISDHGPHWRHFKGDIDFNLPLINDSFLDVDKEVPMSLFALMLVKDFNKSGELKTDWRIMSNADATSIAFNENDPTKIEYPKTRILPATEVIWERKIWLKNQLRITHQFEATDNIYNLENWKKIK